MKRLLRISFDNVLMSLFPVLSYIMLGILVNNSLANIYTITYPIQSLVTVLSSIFATGANIVAKKFNDKNQVNAGILWGLIIGFTFFLLVIYNVDSYLNFMNADIKVYKLFTIYSMIQIFFQYLLSLILKKLHFENLNKQANIYSISFNILNFICLTATALVFKNYLIIIIITLFISFLFILYVYYKNTRLVFKRPKLITYIKYESPSICTGILYLATYFFGLSNSFEFGTEYMVAISFFTLITDVQWDAMYAISELAKVDISNNNFLYKQSLCNALKLSCILNCSSFLMFIIFYPFYRPNLIITLIFLIPNCIDLLIYSLYEMKKVYLQINFSPLKVTFITIIIFILRLSCSFLTTPYCTLIGQEVSIYLSLILISYIFYKNYKINNNIIEQRFKSNEQNKKMATTINY